MNYKKKKIETLWFYTKIGWIALTIKREYIIQILFNALAQKFGALVAFEIKFFSHFVTLLGNYNDEFLSRAWKKKYITNMLPLLSTRVL